MKYDVSVIIPFFNNEDYLEEAMYFGKECLNYGIENDLVYLAISHGLLSSNDPNNYEEALKYYDDNFPTGTPFVQISAEIDAITDTTDAEFEEELSVKLKKSEKNTAQSQNKKNA